jgi:hypothetical protein
MACQTSTTYRHTSFQNFLLHGVYTMKGFLLHGVYTMIAVVPEGYYLQGLGQVVPCPQGEYKNGVGTGADRCAKCADGVTTSKLASTSSGDCHVLLPSFCATAIESDGSISQAAKCPQNFWCPGGNATAAFDPSAPTAAGTAVEVCPYGTFTQNMGASAAYECSKFACCVRS